jgi:hypothetical protein
MAHPWAHTRCLLAVPYRDDRRRNRGFRDFLDSADSYHRRTVPGLWVRDSVDARTCTILAVYTHHIILGRVRRGESFRSNSGDIAENQFMFKAGLRATVSTGLDPDCDDTDFASLATIGAAGKQTLSAGGVGDCQGALNHMSTSLGLSCESDLTLYSTSMNQTYGLVFPSDFVRLNEICPQTCGECGAGSGQGEASESPLQSRPTNVMQLTFEAWTEDGTEIDSGGNILTLNNMKRICQVEADLLASDGFDGAL